ncbi:hypothetical protein ISR94_03535 [Candidatus Microgenomates bacterium]|nr:hypothetical protein [Candidatus Microgenomates bacterium]
MLNSKLDTFEESFSFWKNLVLIIIFFVITPVTLGVSLFSLFSLKDTGSAAGVVLGTSTAYDSGVRVYASLPSEFPTVDGVATSSDARPVLIEDYLERYDSPLTPYAYFLVEIADKYGLDYKLLPAIAQQESNLCKIIPPGGHNCWGWGIHSKGTLGFESFEAAIETVAYGIKTQYIDKGFITPEEIMSKYTPLSDGSWARGVIQFMSEMQ